MGEGLWRWMTVAEMVGPSAGSVETSGWSVWGGLMAGEFCLRDRSND